ncbi:1606_t:CDS:2, partial [Dentiscutata erythropus]
MPILNKVSSNTPKGLFFERVERNLHNKCVKRYTTFTNTQFTGFETFKKVFHVITRRSSLDVPLKPYKNYNIAIIIEGIINEFKSQQNSIIMFYNGTDNENFGPNMTHFQNEESYSVTKKTDIYMLGVLMWEISKNRPPFKPPKEICQLSELTIDMLNDARVEFIEKAQMAYIALYI